MTELRFLFATAIALFLLVSPAWAGSPKATSQAASQTAGQAAQTKGEPVEISGRIMAGLDKVFIKDPQKGFFLVQGVNLAPYSGRMVSAKGLVVGREAEYSTVRLTQYRIQSPDDEGPGAGGEVHTVPEAKPAAKRKK